MNEETTTTQTPEAPETTSAPAAPAEPQTAPAPPPQSAHEARREKVYEGLQPEAPPEEPTGQPPEKAEEPTLIAGKFKTQEELIAAFQKGESTIGEMKARAEAAGFDLEMSPEDKTAAEQQLLKESMGQSFETGEDAIDLLATDPQEFQRQIASNIMGQINTANKFNSIESAWDEKNKDILSSKHLVQAEVMAMAKENPELGKNPQELLNKATERFREMTNTYRAEGKKEATQNMEAVAGSLSSVVTSQEHGAVTPKVGAPPEPPPADSLDTFLKERKEALHKRTGGEQSMGVGPLK